MEELAQLKINIDSDVRIISDIMVDIKNLDRFIESLDDPEAEFLLTNELLKKGDTLEGLASNLEATLKIYLEKESALNLPVTFAYKKLYNQIIAR